MIIAGQSSERIFKCCIFLKVSQRLSIPNSLLKLLYPQDDLIPFGEEVISLAVKFDAHLEHALLYKTAITRCYVMIFFYI